MGDGMEIRDLILDEGELAAGGGGPARGKRSAPAFEVVANSGCDFAVRRTCGPSRRLLAVIVSQGQYYIKDERTGAVQELAEKPLKSWLRGSGSGGVRVGCQWLERLVSAERGCEGACPASLLVRALRFPGFAEAAKSGVWRLEARRGWWGLDHVASESRERAALIAGHPALARSLPGIAEEAGRPAFRSAFEDAIGFLAQAEDELGLDKARMLARAWAESGADPVPDRLLPAFAVLWAGIGGGGLEFGKVLDYLFRRSVEEGFGDRLGEWIRLWIDVLRLEGLVFGARPDKFPENLASLHERLSYRSRKERALLGEEMAEGALEALERLDRSVDGEAFVMTHPSCAQDVRDEAVSQGNCLVAYTHRILDGEAIVMFCRAADDPGASLATVEVDPKTMTLVQAKERFNREVGDDVLAYLAAWCDDKGISPGAYAGRMERAAAAR